MSNQEIYDKLMYAYRSGDENAFNAAARNWVENAERSPFADQELNELFYSAKRHCSLWRGNNINSRVSKLRMIECVRKIAEKDLPNPYRESFGFDSAPKKHIFGIIPTEELAPIVVDDIQDTEPAVEIAEETQEEKPVKKERMFGRRKKK